MGTQQILLIVLSVIIVGVAIAVGISMFNAQAYNSNKTAIAADAQAFATQAIQFYKTPESQGGAGGLPAKVTSAALQSYVSLAAGTAGTLNENGAYTIYAANDGLTAKITGHGTARKGKTKPQIVTTITFATDTVTAAATDVDAADTLPTTY